MSRVHEGCGIVNPYASKLLVYSCCYSGCVLSSALLILTQSWWGELGWLLTPVSLAPLMWWEFVHRPSAMYRTWQP